MSGDFLVAKMLVKGYINFFLSRTDVIAVSVAQLVVAPGCGLGGGGFKSHRSPHAVQGVSEKKFWNAFFLRMSSVFPAIPVEVPVGFGYMWSKPPFPCRKVGFICSELEHLMIFFLLNPQT